MSSHAASGRGVRAFRADARRLAKLPPGLGRDLIELLYGGWLDDCENLWEKYGKLSMRAVGFDYNAERRVYADVADMTVVTMKIARSRSHGGTEFRVASAVIWELCGRGTDVCRFCRGTGRNKRGGRQCRPCAGVGVVRPSNSRRAQECGCRQPEFIDRLLGVYLTVLAGVQRELARALAAYANAHGSHTAALRTIPG
jgi:hypothetical protein